jgi:anti-sigma regulatory factor (Ser/Thr protein kinase)
VRGPWRIVVDLGTASSSREVSGTRRTLTEQLRCWGCTNVSDVSLVLSELETNAVAHAGEATRMTAELLDGHVRLEVDDAGSSGPTMRAQGGAAGGFGLRIVDRLSDTWGWDVNPTGKTVWSMVPCAFR